MNMIEQDDNSGYLPAYREKCQKCYGTGSFRSYNGRPLGGCFACKGKGYRDFKASATERANNRASVAARKARDVAESFELFTTNNPEIMAWINASRATFPFAQAMYDAIVKFGDLTERQLAACQRSVDAVAAREAAKAERIASAPAVATDKLMKAFDAAVANGLKRPKLRFEGFECSLAPAAGKNAGAIYVKSGETYLGKIAAGKFQATRECDTERAGKVVEAMADPVAAAVAYGRRIGSCSCCGRMLVDPVSVARGIGPICAAKFDF